MIFLKNNYKFAFLTLQANVSASCFLVVFVGNLVSATVSCVTVFYNNPYTDKVNSVGYRAAITVSSSFPKNRIFI